MKRIIRIVLLVGIVILTTSSAWVKLTLIRPAVISIPQKIQTIVVVNRALPKDERRNKLEEVLTGEIMRQDEQAIVDQH